MDRYDPYTDKFLRDTQYNIHGTNLAEVGTDLISRQQAIDIAKDLTITVEGYEMHNQAVMNYCADIMQLPPIQPVSCSEFPNNSDAISRQAAIKTALEFTVEYLGGAFDEQLQWELKKELESLPSLETVNSGYLCDWFINSVGDEEPVWTEEHIDELTNDFYVIPKRVADDMKMIEMEGSET